MIFDTWGGALSHAGFHEFSLPYLQQVIQGLTRHQDGQRVPNVLFTKGGAGWLESIASSGCDAVGLDWTVDIGAARERIGNRVALQGNLDPAVLFASTACIRAEASKVLAAYGFGSGHVFNLGHGISRHTPPEHLAALVAAVHELSPSYH